MELMHYGIKGQKWGIRRFQNKDGSRTPAGRKRYGDSPFETTKDKKRYVKSIKKAYDNFDKKTDKSRSIYNAVKKEVAKNVLDIYDSEPLKRARDKYFNTMKLSEDFYSNDKQVREFRNRAYQNEVKRLTKSNISFDKDILKKNHMNGKYDEDPDVGAFGLYLKSKGLDPFKDYSKPASDAFREYHNECKNYTENILGRHGKKTITYYMSDTRTNVRKDINSLTQNILYDLTREEEKQRGLIW